jgi:hypothetical protein
LKISKSIKTSQKGDESIKKKDNTQETTSSEKSMRDHKKVY